MNHDPSQSPRQSRLPATPISVPTRLCESSASLCLCGSASRHRSTNTILFILLALAAFSAVPSSRAADDPIDWDKARQLYQRSQKGEKLSPDDQAYLDRAKAQRAKGNRPGGGAGPTTGKESLGLIPLCDLSADVKYKDRDGGLYGQGKNTPPESHAKLAAAASRNIQPLNADGKPDPNGKIALLSIGMSNTTQEYSRFVQLANADPDKAKNVVLVDGAQGGQAAAQWTNENSKRVWDTADQRIAAAGLTNAQVQVLWIKQAEIKPSQYGEFPKHAKVLQDNFAKILVLAKERYPNVQIAYLSSRIYGGYAATQLNPEPYAYEGAFAVRDAILQQIAGDPVLNPDPAKGPVKAPVALWGPYLWADGAKGRALDTLVFKREDLRDDGTHPSESGRQKIAELLLTFLKSDPTAKPWFTGK